MTTFETDTNAFLRKISARLLKKYFIKKPITLSSDFLTRSSMDRGVIFTDMWFKSRGCRYSLQGGCTMCNYGFDPNVTEMSMIEAVRAGLSSLDPNLNFHLLVSPSGSMLDDWEVPKIARTGIYQLIAKYPTLSFACETRAQYVTQEKIKEIVNVITDRPIRIAIGLESSNQWVLKYSINKSMSLDVLKNSIRIIKDNNALFSANIALGSPFLSERQMIDDTLGTLRWAFKNGADECYIFPIGVKPGTLVEWLWENNLYSPPSLWSMIYVLKNLPIDYLNTTTLAWHKSYYYESSHGVVKPSVLPTTCPSCQDEVVELLDQYIANRKPELLDKLDSWDCTCKEDWKTRILQTNSSPFSEALIAYESAGRNILGDEWWEQNGNNVVREISESAYI